MPLSVKTKMTIAMRNFPLWIAFLIDLNVQPRIQTLNEVQYVEAVLQNERARRRFEMSPKHANLRKTIKA